MDKPMDLSTAEIKDFVTRRLGEKEAGEIMEYLYKEIDRQVTLKTSAVKTEISSWRQEMGVVFAGKEAHETAQAKVIKKVSRIESTLILWGIVFWITQIIAVFCIIKFAK